MSGLAATVSDIGVLQLFGIWAIVVFAAVMRAFTGFGFGLAAVPVFSLFMQPSQAVVLSVMLTLAVSLFTVRTFWGSYPLRPLAPIIVGAVIGTVLGTFILTRFSSGDFQLWIGLLVILASLVLTFYRPPHREVGVALSGVTGLASGLMNGAFAIPGPPVIIFAMATQPSPERSRALLMTFFLFSAFTALASYSVVGLVSGYSVWLFLLAFPAMYLGDKFGYYLFQRHGTALYRRVALVVLFTVGVVTTARALF
jgi:uncharacterized membrane protein YfcA